MAIRLIPLNEEERDVIKTLLIGIIDEAKGDPHVTNMDVMLLETIVKKLS